MVDASGVESRTVVRGVTFPEESSIMAIRRSFRQSAAVGFTPAATPAGAPVSDEITYKGYRIQLESYAVHAGAWSPRVVVSPKSVAGWEPGSPLYATNTARYSTRDEANRRALDVARAWIDDAVARPSPS
jgi:hypothetical protein